MSDTVPTADSLSLVVPVQQNAFLPLRMVGARMRTFIALGEMLTRGICAHSIFL
jgi:hypothetical protein